jgi:hypothetical protein
LSALRPVAYVLLRPATVTIGDEAAGLSAGKVATACTASLSQK